MKLKNLQSMIQQTVITERIHYSNVRGIEAAYYVPTGTATTIGHMAYYCGQEEALELVLNVIKDNPNAPASDIKDYVESKRNQF